MVEVEADARELPAAVLAGVVVARVDVEAREAHLARRDAVVELEQDDARHADGARRGPHHVLAVDGLAERGPRVEVEGAVLLVDDARRAQVEQREGALHRRDMDGLIVAVQDQYVAVDHVGSMGGRLRRSLLRLKRLPAEALALPAHTEEIASPESTDLLGGEKGYGVP